VRPDPVREQIRIGLKSGHLPCNRPSRVSGGYGNAALCICCNGLIADNQIRLTIDGPDLAMHPRCAQLWFEEADWALATTHS